MRGRCALRSSVPTHARGRVPQLPSLFAGAVRYVSTPVLGSGCSTTWSVVFVVPVVVVVVGWRTGVVVGVTVPLAVTLCPHPPRRWGGGFGGRFFSSPPPIPGSPSPGGSPARAWCARVLWTSARPQGAGWGAGPRRG